jgi:hypothetical protein
MIEVRNEYQDQLNILNRYYRALIARIAVDVLEQENAFETPFLGDADLSPSTVPPSMQVVEEGREARLRR